MSGKAMIVAFALTCCALAAACGTADTGGSAASAADAEATTPPADDDAVVTPPMEPPTVPIPRPPGPGTPAAADAPSGGPCKTDADCVPASCCHPKTCVDKSQTPSCAGTMCTLDCRVGTLDCGGGKCLCKDGICAAELKKPGFVEGIEAATKPQ